MTRNRRLGLAIVLAVFLSDQASKLWLLFVFDLSQIGLELPQRPALQLHLQLVHFAGQPFYFV